MRAFVLPQLPYLTSAGWSLSLVSSEPVSTDVASVESRAVPMTREPNPPADARALIQLKRLLQSLQPDVVLGSTPKAGLLAMLAGRMAGVHRRVYLIRGARWEGESGWRRRVLMSLDALAMRAATHNLAVSDSLARLVVSQGLVTQKPTVLGAGGSKGVDRSRFKPLQRDLSRPPVLGFLGRLSPDKGLEEALDAFRAVRHQHPTAEFWVGGAMDRSHPMASQTLTRLNATPGVVVLGPVLDAPAFLQQLNVLLFPSLREGLPNAVIEAAACGVPTVGWDVTGVRDAINPGVTGALVPRGDVSALSLAALDWMRPSIQVQENCRRWSAEFDEALLASRLVEYLERINRA